MHWRGDRQTPGEKEGGDEERGGGGRVGGEQPFVPPLLKLFLMHYLICSPRRPNKSVTVAPGGHATPRQTQGHEGNWAGLRFLFLPSLQL